MPTLDWISAASKKFAKIEEVTREMTIPRPYCNNVVSIFSCRLMTTEEVESRRRYDRETPLTRD